MPAQATKQRNGRYTRSAEISRSRIAANRSTSVYNSAAMRTAPPRRYRSEIPPLSRTDRTYEPLRTSSAGAYAPERTAVRQMPQRAAVVRPAAPSAGAQREAAIRTAKSRLGYFILGAVLFLMAAFMIYRQTEIFRRNQEISELNTQYNDILVTNEEIQSNINKSVELGNLESVAKNELGMISPDSSQVFYIDMGNRDEVVRSGKN